MKYALKEAGLQNPVLTACPDYSIGEQEPYTRLDEMGKQTQHCEARIQQISFSRYGRDRMEVFTLTGGDLLPYVIG